MINFSRIRYILGTHRRNLQGRGIIWNKGTSLTFHLQHMKSALYFVVIISPQYGHFFARIWKLFFHISKTHRGNLTHIA